MQLGILTWNRIGEAVWLTGYKRVFDVPPADAVRAKQHERLAHERRQMNHFFVSDKIELIEDGIVLGQVFVFERLLLAAENATIGNYVALARVLYGHVRYTPLLQLGTRYQAGCVSAAATATASPAANDPSTASTTIAAVAVKRTRARAVQAAALVVQVDGSGERVLGLPPVVIVLAGYL
jgi:hypothetical protein